MSRERPRSSSAAPMLEQPFVMTRRKRAQTSADQYRVVGGHYQLGAEIGKGGFGIVFSALDLQNGRSVAIKQIRLFNMDKSELQSIESEISLLRKLNHENIVKYYATIKTDDHLYIVLEYMENGSLTQLMKKFGVLSETLVAMYISQVLLGLAYLHEQGVLHRDIKGANILTTKDGLVKLADFGVALQTGEVQEANSVVGTPYWMAPEVIEMSGCSAASDIWSVGCTIVELLTGKPPYFDLAPMAALFRIVQDDYPPIPDGISPALNDFIMKCFKKEPRMRPTADDLLKHPWICHIPRNKVAQSAQLVEASDASNDDRDAVLNTIKLYEQVKGPEEVGKLGAFKPEKERIQSGIRLEDLQERDEEDEEDWDDEFGVDSAPVAISLANEKTPSSSAAAARKMEPVVQAQLRALKGDFHLSHEEQNELDNFFWDDEEVKPPTLVLGKTPIDMSKFQEESTDMGSGLEVVDSFDFKTTKFEEFSENAFEELDFEQKGAFDVVHNRILELLAMLHPKMEDRIILHACDELDTLLKENPAQRAQITTQSGFIPNIMEALEVKNVQVLCGVLNIINIIISDDAKFQENLALIGLVPIIVTLAATFAENKEIRVEAAKFFHQSCKTSVLTLQMFIACGGLPVLVDLLHQDTEVAIEGILSVFTLQTIPKNDFCRLFVKAGLLRHLSRAFMKSLEQSENSRSQLEKMCDILVLFSQGDVVVKEHMSDLYVIQSMLHALETKDFPYNQHILKCIRNLSMEPNTVDKLDRAGAIPALVNILNVTKEKETINLIILSMFYLCRINRTRQTQAAQCGLVPYLQNVVTSGSPLKQFALPILCDLAHASNTARAQLWVHDGVNFFLNILSDPYWQLDAVNALVVWLVNDTIRIEAVLLEPMNLFQLIQVFRNAQQADFENLLEPLLEILTKCVGLNQALGRCSLFVYEMVSRLSYPKAMVRKNILKMIKSMFEASTCPEIFVMEYGLYPIVQRLAADENMILVMEIANQILQSFTAALGVS